MDQGIWVVLLVAALAGAAWWSRYAKKKRRDELAFVAGQLGLSYAEDDPFDILGGPFELLSRGDGQGVENVLWGAYQGLDVRAFDYWYYTESRNSEGHTSRSYSRFNAVIVPVAAACSNLTIANENVLTALADHVGLRDIGFESEEFNRTFNVKSPDRKFANDLIDARMMAWLLAEAQGYAFEVVDEQVLVYRKRLGPAEVVSLLGTAKAFVDHVPEVVYSLHPGSAG
ncbi:MAG: hypothetical protein U0V56_04185 [Actinomycetota bacterium]